MLPTYKKILVATDLTPNARQAFKHAVLMAKQSEETKIYLLHAIPQVDTNVRSYVSAIMGEGQLEVLESQHETQAREEISRRLKLFTEEELAGRPADLKNIAGIKVVHGEAVSQILKYAKEIDADVIVMGTHGKGALEHAFLGSVAEKVLRKSKRPVFVVPIPG
jgi:nucleotide-binding universal stress UspA family protein